MMKRLTALLLATIMLFALCACGGKPQTTSSATTDPLTKDDVIKIVIGSHSSWPYRDDWKVWEYIEEGCGATLEVNAYPSTDAGTKIPLLLADPESIPDILYSSSISGAHSKVLMGAAIAFDDMKEYIFSLMILPSPLQFGQTV